MEKKVSVMVVMLCAVLATGVLITIYSQNALAANNSDGSSANGGSANGGNGGSANGGNICKHVKGHTYGGEVCGSS